MGGAGVFVPGAVKSEQRCEDKVLADYDAKAPWPPQASLLDVMRCQIIVDDPYAIAVLVAFLRRTLKVTRVKNRFADDHVEEVNAQRLSAEFYDILNLGSEMQSEDLTLSSADAAEPRDLPKSPSLASRSRTGSSMSDPPASRVRLASGRLKILEREMVKESTTRSSVSSLKLESLRASRSRSMTGYVKNYRDVMLNVEVMGPNKVPIIGEIQVMFGSMAILKKSEQKVYTIMRMQSPDELHMTRAFSALSQVPPDSPRGRRPSQSSRRSSRADLLSPEPPGSPLFVSSSMSITGSTLARIESGDR